MCCLTLLGSVRNGFGYEGLKAVVDGRARRALVTLYRNAATLRSPWPPGGSVLKRK